MGWAESEWNRAFLVYCKIVKLDKVCNFVKLDLSEEYVLIVIKITIFPKV